MSLRRSARLLALLVSLSATSSWAGLLDPGTVLAIDHRYSPNTVQLTGYAFDGTVTGTLGITGLASAPIGLAVLDNRVFVGSVDGWIGEVDPTTGAYNRRFFAHTNMEALGDDGTRLLTYHYNTGVMSSYDLGGALQGTLQLENLGAGLDASGSDIFLGSYGGYPKYGQVLHYAADGSYLGQINTNLGASNLSALGYDAVAQSLWIATGYGDDRIRNFDLSGNLLANFAAGGLGGINGLDVIPGAPPIPEPATALWGMGLLAVVARRRRRG